VVVDIGSGLLDTATPWLADRSGHVTALPWLMGEPAARQTLDDGADLVMFSGDKLLGGPQAGVIAGRKGLVDACARHPLARALRPGSLVLEDLQETVLAYLRADGRSIPFWRMATESCEALRHRATSLGFPVVDTEAVPGGGTLPGRTIPSIGVRVPGDVTRSLREHIPPIIARVESGATICDLRTVDPSDDELLGEALRVACTS
jgi:L-seryl-tRNA(Ser) seleniumtransferase